MNEITLYNNGSSININAPNTQLEPLFKIEPSIYYSYFTVADDNQQNENFYFFPEPYSRIIKKEEFLITAIKNLRKKINFIHLNYEFQNGDINDIEFEKEIEENPDKYVVSVDHIHDETDLNILHEVITKVNENFTLDEISEVFSIDVTGINTNI